MYLFEIVLFNQKRNLIFPILIHKQVTKKIVYPVEGIYLYKYLSNKNKVNNHLNPEER